MERFLARLPKVQRAGILNKLMEIDYARRTDVQYAASLPSKSEAKVAMRTLITLDESGAFD